MKLEIGGMAQDAIPTEVKTKNHHIPKMQNQKLQMSAHTFETSRVISLILPHNQDNSTTWLVVVSPSSFPAQVGIHANRACPDDTPNLRLTFGPLH